MLSFLFFLGIVLVGYEMVRPGWAFPGAFGAAISLISLVLLTQQDQWWPVWLSGILLFLVGLFVWWARRRKQKLTILF
jgi:membrane-bound ClpP family serine protease